MDPTDYITKRVELPAHLLKAIKHRARVKDIDESTAILQLITIGARYYAADMYRTGKFTLNDASDLAGVTVREMIDLLRERRVEGNVRLDQQRKAIDYAIKGHIC